jgi:hypothetical protein
MLRIKKWRRGQNTERLVIGIGKKLEELEHKLHMA